MLIYNGLPSRLSSGEIKHSQSEVRCRARPRVIMGQNCHYRSVNLLMRTAAKKSLNISGKSMVGKMYKGEILVRHLPTTQTQLKYLIKHNVKLLLAAEALIG